MRDISTAGDDADQPGGGADGNLGKIIVPSAVSIQFRGNAAGQGRRHAAVPADRHRRREGRHQRAGKRQGPLDLLRHAPTGPAPRSTRSARAGQLVQRVHDFAGCWNGIDLDSTNHRTHVAFADATTGACPAGFKAIPQLRITLSYRVPPGDSYAVDTFPEQLRKASTDHDDFENVMPARLMSMRGRHDQPGGALLAR